MKNELNAFLAGARLVVMLTIIFGSTGFGQTTYEQYFSNESYMLQKYITTTNPPSTIYNYTSFTSQSTHAYVGKQADVR